MEERTQPTSFAPKAMLVTLLGSLAMPLLALDPATPATGSYRLNGNGNWSAETTWDGAIPNGVDAVAELVNDISTTRTLTIDGGIPGSNVTLGGLRIGDVTGGSTHNISGGTITFQVSTGNAFLTRVNRGGSNTISSAIQLNSTLDVLIDGTNSNSQGITLSGKVSGGVVGTPTINLSATDSDNFIRHLLLNNVTNDFYGQIVVESGLLRLEGADGTGQAAGQRGVGNETIVRGGGRVDLRSTDYNVRADDTEIFLIEGVGVNGLGAIANTTSTATISHLGLTGAATVGGVSTLELRRHLNAAGNADVAAILDLGGHDITFMGTGTKTIENADIQNKEGATFNINEGTVQFRNRGGLLGGELIGGTQYGNNIDGMTFNVMYYQGAYDGVDPTNGSRGSNDLFNPNRQQSDILGSTETAARLSFRTDWTAGNTHAANVKVVEVYEDLTINLNYGSLVREGNTEVGRTFDHIFGTGTTINLVGGGMKENILSMGGGSSSYNSAIDAYDHPGVTEIQGEIDNTTGDNAGTGFTKRGNRELRLTGGNQNFDGDVLIKQNTARYLPGQYTNTSPTGAAESQFFSLSLAGADGGLNQANSITLTRWGSLALLNNSANTVYSSVNNNDRLNDGGLLNLRNGILLLETDTTVKNTENFGNVVADLGTNYLYLDTRAGGQFDGSFASLNFNNGGVLKIYSMNGEQTWGTGDTDNRLLLNDTTGLTLIGTDTPGNPTQQVIPGLFGGTVPANFAARVGAAANRTDYTMQNGYALNGVGIGLMTLDNGYLRPLTADEYHISGTPATGTNWMVDRYIDPGNATGLDNYPNRNVTSDMTVNSLTISFNAASSGQINPTGSKEYVIIEPGKTLTVNSGIINFASFFEGVGGNAEAVIRGGRISMDGQAAVINSALSRHAVDSNSGTLTTFMPTHNAFMRSSIVNATDLIKTGRNNLYLDTWNELSGNVYVSEQGGLFVRHPGALGEGAPGRELVVGGAGNFYLEYGTNVAGIDLRVTNSHDSSRTILAGIGATHNTWGGDIIMDNSDAAGSMELQSHTLTARNNGTLTIYGNIYTANNENISGNDTWNDPSLLTTAVSETATINLRGQVRDLQSGPLASVAATGDGPNHLDRNHSMAFQMRGHDEINVNVFQQWNATGAIYASQGYFRIQYDPTAEGLDGVGFHTDTAQGAIAQDNQWNQMWLGGPQNSLGLGNSAVNAYNGHILLTQEEQVLNFSDRIMVSNNNRNRTLTLGSEHTSGTAYIGSKDNSSSYTIFYQNSNSERDLRFLQVGGGTLVVNARLQDGNNTTDSFNSTVSVVGPGTIIFNRNTENSTVDRWNFMAGTTVWANANGNNQFARTRGTGTNAIASVSTWGGGALELAQPEGATMRTQTLDGDIYLLHGSSSITTNQNTTLTLGTTARTLSRRSGSSMEFLENGNSAINLSATGLSTTAGDFLGSWGVYGNSTDGVTDWAGRQGTTGVQAFAAYEDDNFTPSSHTNLTTNAVLENATEVQTLRFGAAADLEIGSGSVLALSQGGMLIPATVSGNVNVTGGSLTSTWAAGNHDLLVHNYGQGVTTISSVITNDGANKVNLVHSGTGTTVLTEDNTLTGNVYLNGGVLQISSDNQLGEVNGSIERIVLVGAGSSYSSGTTGNAVTLAGGGGSGATATFNTLSSSTTSSRVVNAINVTNGGSGYTSGVLVTMNDGTASNAGGWAVLDSGNLHFDGGVLHATESLALNSGRTIFLGGNGGTLRVDPGKTLTIDGFISGEYNHVHGGNGYNLSDSMGPAWDASSVSNPDIGDLTIDGGGTVVFRYSPLGDGSTPVNLAHVYGGITWINDGILKLEGVATTGATGALGTHRSFLDSTVIGTAGTLDLFTTASTTILEWLTLEGTGYQGAGTIRTVTTGSTAYTYSLAGQIHVKEDAVIRMTNGHNIYLNNGGGDMFGTGDIIRMGNGDFRFYGNNPEWTGAFISASGTSRVIGASTLGGMSSMVLERNSVFYHSTATTSVDEFRDRLPDNLPITGNGYVRLRMDATGGMHAGFEKVGTITAQAGVLGIEYNLGADIIGSQNRLQGDYAGWHFSEIIKAPGASVHLRNLDSGTDFAGSDFSTGNVTDRAVLRVDTPLTLIGSGDGLNGNAPVIPGFFGGSRTLLPATSNGTTQRFDEAYTAYRMVTMETDAQGNHYLRPLTEDEYKTVGNPDGAISTTVSLDEQGLTADQNLRIVGRQSDSLTSGQLDSTRQNSLLTLGASVEVNSLTFNSETYVQSNVANPASSATQGGDYTVLHMRDDTRMTIASGMIQAANFGVFDRMGLTNSGNSNLDLRSQISGGTIDFAGQEAQIYVGGFFTRYNTDIQVNGYETIDGDNTTLTIASGITNANGLVKTGPGSLILTGVNSYTGDTFINHGNLYVRSDFALGQSENVRIEGTGGLYVSQSASIYDVNIHVGAIGGNNLALALEQGGIWGGDIILNNVDSAGATAYNRSFIPRILNNSAHRGIIEGSIYGGTALHSGALRTEARIFTTHTGGLGILDLRGRISDTQMGALGTLVTEANQTQVLRMEVSATTNEASVQLWQQYDAAGQIILKRGYLRYMGEGNFYSDAAAASINPNNLMSGFHMGGRSLIASGDADGQTVSNLAFMLANDGQVFNLSSWTVGGDINDPDNLAGSSNWGLGNTTGNSTLGGENRSGEVVFGTGTGTIRFTPYTTVQDRDLRLYAAPGGVVSIRANFVDGGTAANPVNTSITKVGAGQVNLQGSSAGASTVEAVNVMGGLLVLENYDVHTGRRVGLNASLKMGGGVLMLDGGQEDFGSLTVAVGSSALLSMGTGELNASGLGSVADGGSLHFQSIGGGTIHIGGLTAGTRLGSFATFGSATGSTLRATDWAAVGAGGEIVAFTGYTTDGLGAAAHTDAVGSSLAGGVTASVRFNTDGAAFTSGTLTLNDGGLLFTSNYSGGTPLAAGTSLTSAGGIDLVLHNYASGTVTLAGDIVGSQNVVFSGSGETELTGTNTYSGTTFVGGAATVSMDAMTRMGSGSLHLNGGTINLTGSGSETYASAITLGSSDGTLRVAEPEKVLVLRGIISSETNAVGSRTTNPNSGGLRLEGSGTVQFGGRTDGAALTGVSNTYTGLTILGDGINPLKIDLQGGGGNNTYHTPFGTTDSWTDATIVRNNVSLDYAHQYDGGAGTGQVRHREWMQFGENAGDQVYINHTTQRQLIMEGMYNVIADLNIYAQNAGLTGGGASNSSFVFNANEGSLFGTGDINKTGTGGLYFYGNMTDWTGDMNLRDGLTLQLMYPGTSLDDTGMIYLGDPDGNTTGTVSYRVQSRYGNTDTAIDTGRQTFVVPRNISVRDGISQEVQIGGSSSSEITTIYSGNIYLGSGSTGGGGVNSSNHVRFIYTDSVAYNGALVGHQQHAVLSFTGNLSGTNNLMLENYEDGSANNDLNDQFTTFLFAGDNSGFTGRLTIGSELGASTGNFDRDDNEIFRAGSSLALTAGNIVEMRNLTTFQAGGQSLTIGGLIANDGNSTSGIYSFTSPTWDPTRQTTADLDAVNVIIDPISGTLHQSGGNYIPVGGSSAIIENASVTPGTLTIVQDGYSSWDVHFRDGVPSAQFEDSSATPGSLSLEKVGEGTAVMTIYNEYTGSTMVTEGMMQVGSGGSGHFGFISQGNVTVFTALSGAQGDGVIRAVGTTGTGQTTVMAGASISGTGQIRGDLELYGTLSPGDAVGGVGGVSRGTMFIGGGSTVGNLTIHTDSVVSLQVALATTTDPQLQNGTYQIGSEGYDMHILFLPLFSSAAERTRAFPNGFGEAGSHIPTSHHDHIEISGGIIWNGGQISMLAEPNIGGELNGFNPGAGQIYNLLDWFNITATDWGDFSVGNGRYLVGNGDDNGHLDLPDLSAYPELRWDTGLFLSDGVLVIALIPEPSRALLSLIGLGLIFFRRRR